ncbi:MAG: hypothetical protein GY756_23230, partial [bacterium]|nr:hypothetical protein [bacterium]
NPKSTSARGITHELGHCLGLLHEHQRSDRDDFISVLWENIRTESAGQYGLIDSTLINEEDYNYDYRSIMHYSQYTGNIDWGLKTYEIIDENYNEKWPSYLTEIDEKKVQDIYGSL